MTPDDLLPLTIGMFKTPGLRSPALAAPYFHDGSIDFLEEVSDHYRTFAADARAGLVRNADPEMLDVALVEVDLSPLAAFMRSLGEDFQ
jgi:cytochrome c peroxidase